MKSITIPKSIATKYAGMSAAVVGSKVVAGGTTGTEAIAKALKKFPRVKESDIAVMTLPPKAGVWVL